MSDQIESREQGRSGDAAPVADAAAGGSATPAEGGAVPGPPSDPVARALADVDEAMTQARAGVPASEDGPAVPSDDEVAGLERAHEALRTTLDRVERGG